MVAPRKKKEISWNLVEEIAMRRTMQKKAGGGRGGRAQRLPPQCVPCSSYAQSVVIPGLRFKKISASNIVCVVGSGTW